MSDRLTRDPVDTEDPPEPADPPAGATEPGAPDGGDVGGGGGDGDGWGGGLSWGRAIVLAVAVGFLGLAVGVFVSRDRPPGDGSVDVGFARDMVTHHEQALALASLELAHGDNTTVRRFAEEVLTFQSYEIGVMRHTLRSWGYGAGGRPAEAMGWMGMAPVPYRQMPGMLSEDQMAQMGDARGAGADTLFLQLMADHHRGGLHMAEYAATEAADGDLRTLAARMAHNQATEINEYAATAEREGFDVDIEPAQVPPAP